MMHNMKEGYGDGEVTPYSTQVFSIINWALKPNQPEEPLFTYHMLDICNAAESQCIKAPKSHLSNVELSPQRHKAWSKTWTQKAFNFFKTTLCVPQRAIKGGSFKAPTSSKTGHLKRKKEFSSAMDSNPSQTSASTPVVAEMHKADQQATGGPTSLGVTSEERANPQLSCGMSAFNLNEPISVQPSFKDLDSPEDDPIIVVDDSDEDEEADEVHATTNVKLEFLVPKTHLLGLPLIQELRLRTKSPSPISKAQTGT
ncbi:hypothetical protein Tco_0693289 [Tanacetum coccineum]